MAKTYLTPTVHAYSTTDLDELFGPVETQYIANPSIEESQEGCMVCVDYEASDSCGDSESDALYARYDGKTYPLKTDVYDGRLCGYISPEGESGSFELWLECDGKKSNVLTVPFKNLHCYEH